MSNAIEIRLAVPTDATAIRAIHAAAFETNTEAALVDALAQDGSIVLSLVAVKAGKLVGSVIYSRLLIDGRDRSAVALAPVAVLPDQQRNGIGAALIREAHIRLRDMGERFVLVLGDPAYYSRFGFSAASAAHLQTPYDGPYLMALALNPEQHNISGRVTYPAPFAALE